MEIKYDRAALMELSQDTSVIATHLLRKRDQQASAFDGSVSKFNRLRSEAQDRLYRARVNLSSAEGAIEAANATISSASSDEEGSSAAIIQNAVQMRENAMQEKMKAQAEVGKAQQILGDLETIWQSCGAAGQSAMMALEDRMTVFSSLQGNCKRDLNQYMGQMEKARSSLYGGVTGSTEIGTSSNGGSTRAFVAGTSGSSHLGSSTVQVMPGWCPKNSMKSVFTGTDGSKQFSMDIGGKSLTFPCTKAGAARAYRAAVRSGNEDLVARTAAMYEVETIRESLELTAGEPGVPQLGGYHGDVRIQDTPGFESHHIPSKAVQAVPADQLPALSISHDDHTKTTSYSGKQNRQMKYGYPENVTYKQAMAERIGIGGSGYIEAMRNELYDLRIAVGNRYDGGISGYLDAVIDMFATRGIPKSTDI